MEAEQQSTEVNQVGASFRDTAGFVYKKDGTLLRQINQDGKEDYQLLMSSGLYETLRKRSLIVPHEEVDTANAMSADAYKVIKPYLIPFISHPYEWCFSQIQAAAETTLRIQKIALEHGMSLKDASIYNIQFFKNKAVFIDTLSFEKYEEGKPWVAYRQFCQHFLCPLALMSCCSLSLNQLLQTNLDGVPLPLTSKLLPFRTRLSWGLMSHIHLHAKTQTKYADSTKSSGKVRATSIPKKGLLWLVDSLLGTVSKLKFPHEDTEWGDYYAIHNYEEQSFEEKKALILEFVREAKPERVLDIGANCGIFSRIASDESIFTISSDIDPVAVEKNFRQAVLEKNEVIYPLLNNVCNPPPGIGWENNERESFINRVKPDLTMALALIHHLAISNNLPFDKVAKFFHSLSPHLIIEFVEKGDSQVDKLLANRDDTFPDYTIENFERDFGAYFSIVHTRKISNSRRTLYLMHRQ